MRSPRPVILAAALLTATAAGCASQNDVQMLNKNEFTLRGMIASDHQEIAALQQQVRRLNDQLAEMNHQDEAANDNAGGSAPSLNDRIARLESEVSSLQAGMAAAPGVPPPGAATPGAPGAPAVPGAPAAAPPEEASTISPPPSAPAAIPEPAPTWPNELDSEIDAAKDSSEPGAAIYSKGLAAMKDGKYPLAIAHFTTLQHRYPKSALSEPAEYFAANALYETGKYDQAILQFNDLVMRYPKGRFSAAALLREAQAFLKLNDRIDARLTLQKLASDHGGTPQANEALAMIKGLGND
ncbi:MAG TPA: outer membrane protein assembly factor BamD [Candidatus Binataceae bacterium]|nr:outer membrane protein assembly factor BamD [Candidatus Binataceae bacterium]